MTTVGNAKSYFVLIGGESCDTQGADLHNREYLHTSLHFVAQAYDQLRAAGVPRAQIITIVQLEDYLRSPLLEEGSYARTSTLQSCRRLLAEGGADYDFEKVNSGTVYAVLLGLQSKEFPKVVPHDSSTKSLFFAIYTHGNCHPAVSAPDAVLTTELERRRREASQERAEASLMSEEDTLPSDEQSPASSSTSPPVVRRAAPTEIPTHENEWFAHFPYPCQPQEYKEQMYAFVSTHGGHTNGYKAPECQLYATHIAMIVARLCHEQEHYRPVVGLLNFCMSGGGLDFMRREGFRSFYRPERWPVYIMSSSQANKDALVGGLWDAYIPCLAEMLSTGKSLPSLSTASAGHSLNDLYLTAKAVYRKKNVYELFGHIMHSAYPSSGKSFRSHLQPLLTSGEHGGPDFAAIAQLQRDYRKGGVYYQRKTYIYDTYNWGQEVDLVQVVASCLRHIALPDCVFGELSGVDKVKAHEAFHFEYEHGSADSITTDR